MAQISEIKNEFNRLPQVDPLHVGRIRGGFCVTKACVAKAWRGLGFTKAKADESLSIKTIAAVGAKYDEASKKLCIRDEALMHSAFVFAEDIGLNVTAIPRIGMVNLQQGHDYLSAANYNASIVALCYIPRWGWSCNDGAGTRMLNYVRSSSDVYDGFDATRQSNLQISPLGNNDIGIWKSCIEERRPIFAISPQSIHKLEINVEDICPPSYKIIFDTPSFTLKERGHPECDDEYMTQIIVRRDVVDKLGL